MKVKAFSIESTEIETDETEWAEAKAGNAVGDYYDAWLSDMDSATIVIDPDGGMIDPYSDGRDLMTLVSPILDEIPLRELKDYLIHRELKA